MAGGANDSEEEIISAINVTPLVDIVLVLLIILMVTARAIVSKSIPMELPEASTGEGTPTSMVVSIDERGGLFLDTTPMTRDELRARVRREHQRDPQVRAIIQADGRVSHAKVVQVIDLLRSEDVTRFAINVRPSDLRR